MGDKSRLVVCRPAFGFQCCRPGGNVMTGNVVVPMAQRPKRHRHVQTYLEQGDDRDPPHLWREVGGAIPRQPVRPRPGKLPVEEHDRVAAILQ